jgi:hypothetical protein
MSADRGVSSRVGAGNGVTGRVFISCRRTDSRDLAGRYDRLASYLGDDQVLRDVDTIASGMDFAEVITDAVSRCEVLLAVIVRNGSAPPDKTVGSSSMTSRLRPPGCRIGAEA